MRRQAPSPPPPPTSAPSVTLKLTIVSFNVTLGGGEGGWEASICLSCWIRHLCLVPVGGAAVCERWRQTGRRGPAPSTGPASCLQIPSCTEALLSCTRAVRSGHGESAILDRGRYGYRMASASSWQRFPTHGMERGGCGRAWGTRVNSERRSTSCAASTGIRCIPSEALPVAGTETRAGTAAGGGVVRVSLDAMDAEGRFQLEPVGRPIR